MICLANGINITKYNLWIIIRNSVIVIFFSLATVLCWYGISMDSICAVAKFIIIPLLIITYFSSNNKPRFIFNLIIIISFWCAFFLLVPQLEQPLIFYNLFPYFYTIDNNSLIKVVFPLLTL